MDLFFDIDRDIQIKRNINLHSIKTWHSIFHNAKPLNVCPDNSNFLSMLGLLILLSFIPNLVFATEPEGEDQGFSSWEDYEEPEEDSCGDTKCSKDVDKPTNSDL